MKLEHQIENHFGLKNVSLEEIKTLVNDVYRVMAPEGEFALKLYLPQSNTLAEVEWELALTRHLVEHGAPVVKPVRGRSGFVETFTHDGEPWLAALFEWAPGEKPRPELSTYVLLGQAAARIHSAADSFHMDLPRVPYDVHRVITDQFARMEKPLREVGKWEEALALGERLKRKITNPELDWGICHIDLTLDNVHRQGDSLMVFDFQSSTECWRAYEAWGVLQAAEERFAAWLEGYRSVRSFSDADEAAVAAFAVIGEFQNTAWKLGLARSSRGKPLLTTAELPEVVDGWLALEAKFVPQV